MSKVVRLPSKRRVSTFRPVHDAVKECNDIALLRAQDSRHVTTAIISMKRAVAVTPNSRELWVNLGTLFWRDRQYEEALACYDRAFTFGEAFAENHHNKALLVEDLGFYEEAEKHFARAIELEPNYHNAKWCRSMMRLSLGDYAHGWPEYEVRISCHKKNGQPRFPTFPPPYWQGEDIKGKRIFCCAEQGIGDTIMFSRWLPWLKDQVGPEGKVYFCCSHEVMLLLWEFVDAGIVEYVPERVAIPKCDYGLYIGSLPARAGCTLDTLPSDPGFISKRAQTQMRIGRANIAEPMAQHGFKVGICWTGNVEQDRNAERTIPLELMLGLAEHPNVWLYSLQVGSGPSDIERLGAKDIVCDLGAQLKERGLAVAATAIKQMDLVVTCCTSIAHLAGALGVPAWVMLCKNPYWVWMHNRVDSPWYPSLRLFRQKETGEWKSVMQQVRDELIDRVDARRNQSLEVSHG